MDATAERDGSLDSPPEETAAAGGSMRSTLGAGRGVARLDGGGRRAATEPGRGRARARAVSGGAVSGFLALERAASTSLCLILRVFSRRARRRSLSSSDVVRIQSE